jgi:Cdc6-like AAA superfamily ATPase
VFTDVSSALAQLKIYESIGVMDNLLLQQIHLVMVSIVKICAHVVKYRQGCRKSRLKMKIDSIFHNNQALNAEMDEFRRTLQAQRDVEGTVTLSVLVETRQGVVQLLERFAVFGKTVEDTHQGVQALRDDNDRTNILIKIRNTLQVPTTVLLDTRTTNTCTLFAAKCLPGTGSWIWTDNAFISWTEGTAKGHDNTASNVLVVSGPPSSGKTLVAAQITKRLEEEKGRTYAAHYFFLPASSKKVEEDNKYPVHSALRYMAFQIAKVDATIRKTLGKACDSENVSMLTRNSTSSLDSLWQELKIGTPGLGATYYLVFDGIENLDEKERKLLLNFVFSPKLAKDSVGRVRVLVSGTDKMFEKNGVVRDALQIEVEKYNALDMRIFIEDRLNKQGLLRHAKPGSIQQKAKDNVIAKLPQKAAGSYSQLKFALDEIVRLLSSRISLDKLDKVLDHPMNSHETAIEALQRSLTPEEIAELNEMLKWVHFSGVRMTVAELEAAMVSVFLHLNSMPSVRWQSL